MIVQHTGSNYKDMVKLAVEKLHTTQIMDVALGSILCGVAALITAALAVGRPWSIFVPLFFSVVLLLVAGFFGSRAGIVSTLIAAIIFAGFLYGPLKSIHVANDSARANLGWMLLIGIAFSFLFAPPTSGLRRH
ncbi:MAG TPA: DUF4118 domain-containing protein [Candidatus Angelobacter sp.]|nr:DUF4118 domain-containing protein [Candidatus Angelobacter sp.]